MNVIILYVLVGLILLIGCLFLFFFIKKRMEIYNLFINNGNEIMWILDKNYIVKFISDADKKIRGFDKKEVVGKSILKHIAKDSIYIVNMMREVREDEESRQIYPKTRTIELDFIKKDSTAITMEVIINYDYKGNKLVGFHGVARDITFEKVSDAELYFKANNDPLTKLDNRRSFMDSGKREFELAKRHHKPLSVLMLDIDFFKKINDTYGHDAGDKVLQEFAEAGAKVLRNTDFFGRLGGEEFAVLATETNLEGAIKLSEKLRATYEKHQVCYENFLIKFTVSIGVTTLNVNDKNFEEMLKRADKLLYKAKNTGRNKVIYG